MRLLDRVAQSRSPLRLSLGFDPDLCFDVTGPSDFSALVSDCPLRFVLGDDVTRASGALAFADGARLAGCLDLLRVPAPLVWVEWNDEVHMRIIRETGFADDPGSATNCRRAGALIRASADGRVASLRTFWGEETAVEDALVTLSPIETLINLREGFDEGVRVPAMFHGGLVHVSDHSNGAMAALLDHVRFRLDETWARYYRAAAPSPQDQRSVVASSLAAVARDTPLLLAFLLLHSARDATRLAPVSRAAINRKRQSRGRSILLDHLEVHSSLDAVVSPDGPGVGLAGRQSPRLHHVRGHLVRRDNHVFWRTSHLRGSAIRGTVRSRTVHLSFSRQP